MKRFLPAVFLLLLIHPASAQDTWVEVSSPNFKINTNAGGKQGTLVAQRYEQMRQFFASLIQKDKAREDVPLTIVAFKNLAEVKQTVPTWRGKSINVAGFYAKDDASDIVLLDLSSEDAWQSMFHGYAHAMLAKNYQQAPLWFHEGFADYFSTIRITKEGVFLGETPKRFAGVNLTNLYPLEKFLVMSASEADLAGEKRGTYSTQAWLLVHFLYDNRMITRAARYFTLTEEREVPKADAFQQAFNMTFAEMDAKLREYVQAKQMAVVKWNVPPGAEPYTFSQRKLKDFELLALRADLWLRAENLDQAETAFTQIIEKRPDYEPAHRGLGHIAVRRKKPDEADNHFRKAVALGTRDPRVYLYMASARFDAIDNDTSSEDLIEIAGLLDKAILLNASLAPAYALKSEVVARGRNLPEAIKLGKKAIQLDPTNEKYRLDLAFKHLYQGDLDIAIGQYTELAGSRDAAIAEEAKKQLAVAKQWKAQPLMRLNAKTDPYYREPKAKQEQVKISAELEELLKAQTGEADDEDKDTRPVKFVKGTLVSVDCSVDPGAVLSLSIAGKPMKLKVKSRRKVLLIGGENFDCGWKNKTVAANYKVATGKGVPGDVVSLEIQ